MHMTMTMQMQNSEKSETNAKSCVSICFLATVQNHQRNAPILHPCTVPFLFHGPPQRDDCIDRWLAAFPPDENGRSEGDYVTCPTSWHDTQCLGSRCKLQLGSTDRISDRLGFARTFTGASSVGNSTAFASEYEQVYPGRIQGVNRLFLLDVVGSIRIVQHQFLKCSTVNVLPKLCQSLCHMQRW